ncbi:ribosomal protein S18-alanine N-acetyltransferase [Spirulina major CS-329]|uniref:ribosomal protein S18-alanine N-acetyltransferase n=1 Tax=Spirulina TaxID=1154 RepID=UPI00232CBBB3|nr:MULTISPECIES: ribosomal protein S18-alanine N-acetyltransferase [Spirulina]MDB9496927.1 ribosomal protein S18-alanine N-acetyltransferase [Spirulina subsalsa CS-330]MDB9501758.1 ribosomal protein S18-alanine N-acetyltransferase [Spirulina major CS-329]
MTLSSLQIKPLTPAQLNAVVELDRHCLGGMWSLDGYQRELESPNSELLVITPERGAIAPRPLLGLGCFWAILEEAHITLLMIHPDYQGQGLGQWLLGVLLAQAVARGLERATLEVREGNRSAIALYQKFGFQAIGRRPGYYGATGEDALIFWLNGLHQPGFTLELSAWHYQHQHRLAQQGWQVDSPLPIHSLKIPSGENQPRIHPQI